MSMFDRKHAPKQYKQVDRERKVSDSHHPGFMVRGGSNYTPRDRHPLTRAEKIVRAQAWRA
jgi:hypothetical protein